MNIKFLKTVRNITLFAKARGMIPRNVVTASSITEGPTSPITSAIRASLEMFGSCGAPGWYTWRYSDNIGLVYIFRQLLHIAIDASADSTDRWGNIDSSLIIHWNMMPEMVLIHCFMRYRCLWTAADVTKKPVHVQLRLISKPPRGNNKTYFVYSNSCTRI